MDNMKIGGIAVFGVLLLGLLVNGCGQTIPTGTTTPSGLRGISFYSEASNITPVFIPSSRITALSWGSGNSMYAVFYALREYLHPQEDGTIDRANIYRLLYDVENLFSNMTTEVVALATPGIIDPPFDFGNNVSYEAAINNTSGKRAAAMVTSGNVTKGIVTWIWADLNDPNHNEYGVLEAVFNNTTKDLTVDFIFSVDYNASDTATVYNNRTHISGNSATHAFEFIQTIGGSTASSNLMQIVGKGVSQGVGENFLLKVKSNYNDGFNTPLYVVVSSEANEDTLRTFTTAEAYTSPPTLPAVVASYKNYVENTAFFEFADLLVNLQNLNAGNAKAGTIYLNY